MTFTGEDKDVFGVEPICRVLTQHGALIAPSTYYAARSRPPPARPVRDEQRKAEITRVWKENYEVYGVDKVWLELNRQGIGVARCTVERLMRGLGLAGVRRGRKIRTTIPGKDGQRAGDLLNRDFTAPAPNRRWVAGFTHVTTWAGVVYALKSAPRSAALRGDRLLRGALRRSRRCSSATPRRSCAGNFG